MSPARITVIHNGILVQDDVEPWGPTSWLQHLPYTAHADKLPLGFQDHGNPVRYRNIWLRELPETTAPGPPEDPRPVVNLPLAALDRYVGKYRVDDEGSAFYTVSRRGPPALLRLLVQRAAARARRPLGDGVLAPLDRGRRGLRREGGRLDRGADLHPRGRQADGHEGRVSHPAGRSQRPAFLLLALLLCGATTAGAAGGSAPTFHVCAFYTDGVEEAHLSFVREANRWFAETGRQDGFSYEATADWSRLEPAFLSRCGVVLFLDARPDAEGPRAAFREYMEKGGAWMGFHFAGFALTPSDFPQDWSWYHDEFLGAGSYRSNTWRPTSALLRVEAPEHPALRGLPATFTAAPNEWYRWEKDLRQNPAIQILLAIDPSSFPLGTGRSRTRSGTRGTTRSPGRTATTAWRT